MTAAALTRRFSVHSAADVRARAHILEGVSFEDAALHFVEDAHPAADAEGEAAVMVEDCETGEQRCFRIDLETGASAPCD